MTLFEIFQEFRVWKKFSLTAICALIFLNVVLWRYDEDCFPFVLQTWKKISFFQIWNEKEWLIFINTKLKSRYVYNDRTLCLWCIIKLVFLAINGLYSVQILKTYMKNKKQDKNCVEMNYYNRWCYVIRPLYISI